MYEYSFERQIEFPLYPFIINHPPFSPQSKSYSQTLILYTASMASKNFYYLSACDLDKRFSFYIDQKTLDFYLSSSSLYSISLMP
ncbi:hypothetical protein HanRHA438_Chr06g0252081 [Helianthus annuus]|uniref:Uncharacterized protein n=1 Tax=Helianthus annuus TaxID=4232 RepID=A0A251UFE7_HELAN|nr:hypothetical protein HanXRQr2_Chr06g0243051 [Helianthus annuus]KAJ0559358.1 hypothetical protein HanHA300_Chr06g0199471 [Helianthus annuus]KAJ0565301.1 hypothetical protein HanIR_Chr06g0261101 [Helianthus annuus]KAJ0572307.1 hypothetical protein HanHA89_Chr06g0214321 [Helianthus annuus]KAJ0736758.1 hypothetical protein HanLR1_Chr06g0199451 [Helianthus annuus]